jgi:DNA-directed RNA polymerase II subunit RPB2
VWRRYLAADKDILEHVVYDFDDHEMMELLRPSIEEAFVIQSQAVALDYIGKRGSAVVGAVQLFNSVDP